VVRAKRKPREEAKQLRLDLGCGKNPREGFTGVDIRNFGQPIVADLRKKWPWADGSVEEVHCSHFVEHLSAVERIHFANELYRVLVPEGKATVIAPHWNSPRAYGDLTHQWPPICEWWFLYLNKEWRESQAPHSGYTDEVNFEITYGYSLRPDLNNSRDEHYRQYAMQNYKDSCQDIISTWVKK
jgi:hypothetical protein